MLYLTEGGQETELMYRHGHDLPEFALYPLLDDSRAMAGLQDMYRRYLEVAAEHQLVAPEGRSGLPGEPRLCEQARHLTDRAA